MVAGCSSVVAQAHSGEAGCGCLHRAFACKSRSILNASVLQPGNKVVSGLEQPLGKPTRSWNRPALSADLRERAQDRLV